MLKETDLRIDWGGKDAAEMWRKWKDWIFQTIEMSQAKPTMYAALPEEEQGKPW